MFPPWLMFGREAAGIVDGATATGIILVTSGPLADTGPSAPPPAVGSVARATATAGASATKLGVADPFDPAKLPPVDTKDWVAYVGPRGG